MPVAGEEFNGYVIDSLAGRGGTAQVYLAHRAGDENAHAVALKVLDLRHRDSENIDRLHREFDLAQRFSHPRIIAVYERGEDWLAMEALTGGSARDLVGTNQNWTMPIKLTALQQIAGALDYIHEAQVVHCDVKPSNIMRRPSGSAVLTDFGIAQELVLADGPRRPVVTTSLPYAAPEVLRGQPVTAATDQYALACTAVELFDGKPPFVARTAIKLADLQLNASPSPISYRHKHIPHAFDSIVAKAMAKDPLSRYPTCTEFITLLTHAMT
ncbi:serine/threonine-protein kinase [Mycobacteroides chelonae]|nr:serine/threonine-protein kinase [Mycobacteroides chelonae]